MLYTEGTTSAIKLLNFMQVFCLLCIGNDFLLTRSGAAAGDEQVIMYKDSEREALLTLKQGLTNMSSDFSSLSSWGRAKGNKECCHWEGVGCNHTTGHVIFLNLYFLRGQISPAIQELHHLNSLDIATNDFGGNKIPEFIGSLEKLEYLRLSDNNFSGEVPYHLGNLTNLRELDLSSDSLTSKDLSWLSNLAFLSKLSMSWNQFVGPLSWLSNLTLLSNLRLDHNKFEGAFPDLKAFSSLEFLHLRDNKLTGQLPITIGQLSSLVALDVSYNSLQGTISEDHLSKLHNLLFLDLSLNSLALNFSLDWSPPFNLIDIRLRGCNLGPHFPSWLQTQSVYNFLDISSAGISAEAPIWFWNMSAEVRYLNLSYNHISGSITDLSSTGISSMIDISSNNFSGPVPFFHPHSSLIQLSSNMFTGSIGSLCRVQYYYLFVLDLSKNELSGEIPSCWENIAELLVLNLADNKFSGYLPHSLGSLSQLRTLQFRNNNLTGNLPSTLKNCINLQLIDGAGNGLTGNVPAWMGMFMNLTFLRLHQNHFGGSIPLEICRLKWIQVLDLSENNFSGTIPPCFNNFTSLLTNTTALPVDVELQSIGNSDINQSYVNEAIVKWKRQDSMYKSTILGLLKLIDLSSNNFVGNIPQEFSLFSGLVSLNLSQNSLTGNISPDIDEMKMLESLDLSRNKLSGIIPTGLAELHYLSVLDLSSNNLSGEIPRGSQLQLFDASAYAGNNKLCGDPLPKCSGDDPINPGIAEPKDEGLIFSGLISLNLSGNSLTGDINPDINRMKALETLDLSRNNLSGVIPTGLAELHYLAVLDLSSNNLSGEIPRGSQLQLFDASAYAGNNKLCGDPLPKCSGDNPINPGTIEKPNDEGFNFIQSLTEEYFISVILGFIVGFWCLVGPLVMKRSWRDAYYGFLSNIGDWLYLTVTLRTRRLIRYMKSRK